MLVPAKEAARQAPDSPGVYIFRDSQARALYIGKAISLRKRLCQHLSESRGSRFVEEACSIEWVVAESAHGALVVEDALIKRHKPRYNIKLRDDKSYPYVVIKRTAFPYVSVTRDRLPDGSTYFGPYTNVRALRHTVRTLARAFGVRTCRLDIAGHKRTRMCLDGDMGRCCAPCTGGVDDGEYGSRVRALAQFLSGRRTATVAELRGEMEASSRALRFERAARIRDAVFSLERIVGQTHQSFPPRVDCDILAGSRAQDLFAVVLCEVREGRLIDRKEFVLEAPGGTAADGLLSEFASRYYARAGAVPSRVVSSEPLVNEVKVSLAGLNRGVRFGYPVSGAEPFKRTLADALSNAKALAIHSSLRRPGNEIRTELTALGELVGMSRPPIRIVGFDASAYQRKRRRMTGPRSALEDVAGVSRSMVLALLRRFETIDGVAGATAAEIAECAQVSLETAREVLEYAKRNRTTR